MLTLLIDTTSPLCCLALIRNGKILADLQETLGNKHAELLIIKIKELLHSASVNKADLERIAVVIGPGSFTGIRISIATAKALSLGLMAPSIGVDGFSALAIDASNLHPGLAISVVFEAYREELYVQEFDTQALPKAAPFILPQADIHKLLPSDDCPHVFIGNGVKYLKNRTDNCNIFSEAILLEQERPSLRAYAKLLKEISHRENITKPQPLYIRGADAQPSKVPSFVDPEVLRKINPIRYGKLD